ncbi:hypothetical protein QJS66_16825 [Kocuria rhizophila]|nr:hypothetical protein QJS66_16825 [Kocuria rhizophila]
MAFMATLNLIALVMLSGVAVKVLQNLRWSSARPAWSPCSRPVTSPHPRPLRRGTARTP